MPYFMFVIGKHFESCCEYKECHKINKIIYLFYQFFLTNVINFVRGIIKLSLLTALKVFVFIMDSCDCSAIDHNNCQLWINILNDLSFTIFCSVVAIIFSVSKLVRCVILL